MAVVCKDCHKAGRRAEMKMELLPQSKSAPSGDRFPGEMVSVPAVYHYSVKYTCPDCGREDYE